MSQLPGVFRPNDVTPKRSPGHRWLYASTGWTKLSKLVRRRDPMCKLCQVRPSTIADHITALADGGAAYDMNNLQGICHQCNVVKTRQEVKARAGGGFGVR
jgi:5-methylcytosine-specific restriction enzyme A